MQQKFKTMQLSGDFGNIYIPGTYQVRPHLIPETGIDVAYAAWRIMGPWNSRSMLIAISLVQIWSRWGSQSLWCVEEGGSICRWLAQRKSDVSRPNDTCSWWSWLYVLS